MFESDLLSRKKMSVSGKKNKVNIEKMNLEGKKGRQMEIN